MNHTAIDHFMQAIADERAANSTELVGNYSEIYNYLGTAHANIIAAIRLTEREAQQRGLDSACGDWKGHARAIRVRMDKLKPMTRYAD